MSPTLDEKVDVEYFINKMTHKPNGLRFWVKMRCPTHLMWLFKVHYGDSWTPSWPNKENVALAPIVEIIIENKLKWFKNVERRHVDVLRIVD